MNSLSVSIGIRYDWTACSLPQNQRSLGEVLTCVILAFWALCLPETKVDGVAKTPPFLHSEYWKHTHDKQHTSHGVGVDRCLPLCGICVINILAYRVRFLLACTRKQILSGATSKITSSWAASDVVMIYW